MRAPYVLVTAGAVALALLAPSSGSSAAPASGELQIVQAVPGLAVDILIDGTRVRDRVGVGTVVGPYSLAPGSHEVRFLAASGRVVERASVRVRTGLSSDVVLHRPAAPSGPDVVNVYTTPRAKIGPGKARVLIAHTATVAPADVRVDGKTVFTNIANGEYATADVPSGAHRVALFATGQDTHPILGPIDVTLEPRTVTMVYAVGTPRNGSMRVIAHVASLAADGTVRPATIKTGTAGLARGPVSSLGTRLAPVDGSAAGPGGGSGSGSVLPVWWR